MSLYGIQYQQLALGSSIGIQHRTETEAPITNRAAVSRSSGSTQHQPARCRLARCAPETTPTASHGTRSLAAQSGRCNCRPHAHMLGGYVSGSKINSFDGGALAVRGDARRFAERAQEAKTAAGMVHSPMYDSLESGGQHIQTYPESWNCTCLGNSLGSVGNKISGQYKMPLLG